MEEMTPSERAIFRNGYSADRFRRIFFSQDIKILTSFALSVDTRPDLRGYV